MKISHIVHKVRSLRKERQNKENQGQEKRAIFIGGLIIVVAAVIAVGILTKWTFFLGSSLSTDTVKAKTEQFIFSSNLSGGKKVEIKEISDAGAGIYKIMVQLEGAPSLIESYITKDGKLFFPNVMKMDPTDANKLPQTSKNIPKSDKPNIELFVMSYCPFGTQIEKGIIPVLETLGSAIDFRLKFVNYTLHGKKEFDENINQYCIEKEAPQALVGYLKCFDGTNSNACLAINSISAATINACVSATDKKYKLTALFEKESKERQGNSSFPLHEDENKAYGVKGSPALVINGTSVESSRDSASLLKTICSAFTNKPSTCDTKLSDVAPGPGFGNTPAAAGGAATAGCETQ